MAIRYEGKGVPWYSNRDENDPARSHWEEGHVNMVRGGPCGASGSSSPNQPTRFRAKRWG